MNWSTFLTYLAQGGIVLVVVFVASAMISAIVDGLKKDRDD